MSLKYKNLFGCRIDPHCLVVQQWAGDILANAELYSRPRDLENCRRKILLVQANEIVQNLELYKKVAENNFFIIVHISEITSTINEIHAAIPQAKHFPFLLGGEHDSVESLSMDTFYFRTLTDTNAMVAKYYTINQIFQKKQKPYSFLYLNGANHEHRNSLWKKVQARGLLEGSLCSYLGYGGFPPDYTCDIPFKKLPQEYDSPLIGNVVRPDQTSGTFQRSYNQFKQESWNGQWIDGHIVPQQYIDTYFTVITETTAKKLFITEKTYKSILAGHPFIIFGAPGTYRRLQEMGFRTFAPWIDESFDEVMDLRKRIDLVVEQIARLCRGNLSKFLEEVQPICQHNQRFYIDNKENFFYKKHQELAGLIKSMIPIAEKYFAEETK